jgi:hypothetical protein
VADGTRVGVGCRCGCSWSSVLALLWRDLRESGRVTRTRPNSIVPLPPTYRLGSGLSADRPSALWDQNRRPGRCRPVPGVTTWPV